MLPKACKIWMAVLFLLAIGRSSWCQTYPTETVTISGLQTGAASGSMTITFNRRTETVPYGPLSTPGSLASAFAAKFSQDPISALPRLCTLGVCAKAYGPTITFQLSPGSSFGAMSVTSSATTGTNPFSVSSPVVPVALPSPGGINTIAGNGTGGYTGDWIAATSGELYYPGGVAVDRSGNIYIADQFNNRIRKVTAATGIITTIAGNGTQGYSGDGGMATNAELSLPTAIAIDGSGNVYIADYLNYRIRKVMATTGIITTIAGNGTYGYSGDGGAATNAELNYPTSVAIDGSGNVYIADQFNNRIRKVTTSTGIITTIAGNGTQGYSGDGGAATSAELYNPYDLTVDAVGNLYIADAGNQRIRKVTVATGVITTIAGNGTQGYSGDGGAAASAELNNPAGVRVDAAGNLYIADRGNNRIREALASTGIISTIAGNGTAGFSGDGGAAVSAELNGPLGLALDTSGNIYVSDHLNHRVRAIAPLSTPTLVFASIPTQTYGAAPFTVSATSASPGAVTYTVSSSPANIATISGSTLTLTGVGSVTINATQAATANYTSASASTTFTVNPATPTLTFASIPTKTYGAAPFTVSATSASTGAVTYTVSSTPANIATISGSTLTLTGVGSVTVAATQAVTANYTSASASTTFTVNPAAPTLTFASIPTKTYGASPFTVSATSASAGAVTYTVSSSPANIATISASTLTLTGAGSVTVNATQAATANYTSASASTTFTVNPATPTLTFASIPTQTYGTTPFTVSATSASTGAVTYTVSSSPANIATISGSTLTLTGAGSVTVNATQAATANYTSASASTTFTVNPALPVGLPTQGGINTVAGNGINGYTGDGIAAISAELSYPGSVAVGGVGDIYIADVFNERIRRVTAANGIITTVAGGGSGGDGSLATNAQLNSPSGVAVDAAGNLYVADTGNNRIRKVTASTGVISTIAGNGTSGYSGDGGAATNAELNQPASVAIDGSGNIYFADSGNDCIREVTISTGVISTIAGICNSTSGTNGYSGDGEAATNAKLSHPAGIAIDGSGNLYIADSGNSRIRKVTAGTGIITTVAGSNTAGYAGDGAEPTSAELNHPSGIAIDSSGNLYIADSQNNRIREAIASTGIITTIAGTGTAGFAGDGGAATGAELNDPLGIALNSAGNLYIADYNNQRVRAIAPYPNATLIFTPIPTQTYGAAPFTVSASSVSTGAITYAVTSGPATISGSTVTLIGAGGVQIEASQAAAGAYPATTGFTAFTVNPATPTLAFTSIPTKTYGATPFTVSTTSASTGAVTYTVSSSPANIATISGSTLTLTGAGSVTVNATQAATANYTSASASTTFIVNPAAPTLTFASIPTKTYGAAPFTVSATSASAGAVTYTVSSSPANIATISGSTLTLTGAGSVTVNATQAATANYTSASASTTFTVNPGVPTLSFASIPTQMYGAAPFTVSASSASPGAVTYAVSQSPPSPATISGSTVTLTGVGTVTLIATQAATANYTGAAATITFTVNPGVPTLSFASIPTQMYGAAPFTVSANSASPGAVTYSVSQSPPSPATISGLTVTLTGVGTVTLIATQAATANYTGATATITFTVNPGVPTLSFTSIPTQMYGAAPFTVSASSVSPGAVTYSVSQSPPSPATISGSTVTLTGAGTVTLIASQAATANYTGATATTTFTVNPGVPVALPGQGQIGTVAGYSSQGYNGDWRPATLGELSTPNGVAVDSAGNLYIADDQNQRIREVTATNSTITTVAGNGTQGYLGDEGSATNAELNLPNGVAVDSAGNIYIAELFNNRIRKVTAATGVIATIAGNGTAGFSGDGGPAISAELAAPTGVAVDGAGNIYIADSNNSRIRKVTTSTGVITTIAGYGAQGDLGDEGPATNASLFWPRGVALDSAGNIYIADSNDNRIRKVMVSTGVITTIAGNGSQGYSGDGVPATNAELNQPFGVTVDTSGNIYIADTGNNRIREVNPATGIIVPLAGTGVAGFSGDGGPALNAELNSPVGIAIDASNHVYVADSNNNRIRAITQLPTPALVFTPIPTQTYGTPAAFSVSASSPSSGAITYFVISGPVSTGILIGTNGQATTVWNLTGAGPVVLGAYQSRTANYAAGFATVSFTVNPATPVITWSTPGNMVYGTALSSTQLNATANVAGTFSYSPAPGTVLPANNSIALTATFTPFDTTDYTQVSKTVNVLVSQAMPTITWAPPATMVYGTPLTSTQLNATANTTGTFSYSPAPGTVLSANNNITLTVTFTPFDTTDYASPPSKTVNVSVTQATPVITWPIPASINYGTPLSQTELDATANVNGLYSYSPTQGTVLDAGPQQTLTVTFIPTDTVDYKQATTTTQLTVNQLTPTLSVATSQATANFGSSVTFTATISNGPTGNVAFHDGGTFLGNGNISGNTATLAISTLTPGTHTITASWNGSTDYAPVTSSAVTEVVNGISIFGEPNVINTIAGNGTQGYSGDTGLATGAQLEGPIYFIRTDGANNVYFCDGFSRVRKVAAATGIITTVTGNGTAGYAGDNQLATNPGVQIYCGYLAVDTSGDVFIVDNYVNRNRIREVSATTGMITTIAGTGTPGYTGDNGPASQAEIATGAVVLDAAANLYFENDYEYGQGGSTGLRKVNTSTGTISTIVDLATNVSVDGGLVLLTVDPAGDAYVYSEANQLLYTFFSGSTQSAPNYKSVSMDLPPWGPWLSADASGNLTAATSNAIFKLNAATGNTSTVRSLGPGGVGCVQQTDSLGDGCFAVDAPANSYNLPNPYNAVPTWIDSSGNMYVAGAFSVRGIGADLPTQVQGSGGGFTTTGSITYGTNFSVSAPQAPGETVSLAYTTPSSNSPVFVPPVTATLGATNISLPTSTFPVGNYTVYATYSGSSTLEPGLEVVDLAITKATPVVTWPAPAPIAYGTPLGPQQLNASSSVPGAFTYTPGAGTVLPVGSNNNSIGLKFNPTDGTDYSGPITMSQPIQVTTVTPTVSWPTPAPIEYGTPLSSTQLNATANVAGTFAYTQQSGTILPVGPNTLTVTFTPTSSSNNSSNAPVIANVQLQVNSDTPTITSILPNPVATGAQVTIYGQNFGPSQGSNTLTFNVNGVATAVPVSSWTNNSIVTTVPSGATTGNVVVNVNGSPSNSFLLMISNTCP